MGQMSKSFQGTATVLAVGTAVPPNSFKQADYPDYYFRVTNSEHVTDEFKQKFARLCKATKIENRHLYLTEKMLQENPNLASYDKGSYNARSSILSVAVPELGRQASEKAFQQWGVDRSKITHLILHSCSASLEMPGPDVQLANLLQLSPDVNRFMLYYNSCSAGGSSLRLAKDLAENNPGARVLVVCAEICLSMFRGPSESDPDSLLCQALFGDGAGAVIVGSNLDLSVERPLFEILSAQQSLIPGSTTAILGGITEAGLFGKFHSSVPMHIANGIRKCTSQALAPLGITDLNSLFWMVHPGGPKILDRMESELKLEKEKYLPSRSVLTNYGNVGSPSVFFVMDEMMKRSKEEGKATLGEGLEYGLLLGLGAGLTVETLLLRAHANPN